jgi:cysteine desulfurase family protein (TIGR01976 family)
MSFDLVAVRAKFPALAIQDNGKRRIYFDNPAGTQVPASVAEAVSDCLLSTNANRGTCFQSSIDVDAVVAEARSAMKDFLNATSSDEIVFGQNMTTITFHLARSIGKLFRPGDEIILSRMDHDANVWPWALLARDLGLQISWLPFNTDTFEFDLDVLENLLSERTRLVCVGGASNLTGTLNDVQTICAKAREVGALTYIDAVQSAPHVATDVQAIGCDFLVCSSYKFFGPHQGILWGRREILEKLEPYQLRPASRHIPDCFETGTQSHEGFAGITAAVDYFAWIGRSMTGADDRRSAVQAAMTLLFEYEKSLTTHLIEGLVGIEGVTVQGITSADAMDRRVPTVAFTHDRIAPATVAQALAQENIFVWNGFNYAVEVAKSLGIYETGGAVRVGPVHYNSHDEIDELLIELGRIVAS